MESYSPSIQKLCVFLKSQSDISNNGISFLNNFLTDTGNAIIVESIHSSKSHKHKTILIEDIESGLNVVFPSEIADAIINQSKGRIQHTSMKNLMQVKTFGTNQNLSSSMDSTSLLSSNTSNNTGEDLDLDDSDVEGFEIIPNNNSIYAHDVSPCFPIELVFKVTADYISRKKLIHTNPSDFYSVLEQQDSNHVIYTFISYALENITTKILNRISSLDIDEDVIRSSIQENPTLNSIRHKVIQASNIANKLLASSDVKNSDLPTSLSNSFIYNQSLSSNSLSNSFDNDLINDSDSDGDIERFKNNSIIINDYDDDNKNNQDSKLEQKVEEKPTSVAAEETNKKEEIDTNININNNNTDKNNDINKNLDSSEITKQIKKVVEDISKSIVNKNNVQNINNINNKNSDDNNNSLKLKEENIKLLNNIKTILNNSSNTNKVYEDLANSTQIIKRTRKVPNLFRFDEPIDLVQAFVDGIHLEITNGMFLVLLVLVGFALQNFVKAN
ncbi:hypothetical protein DICPUDRAFT_153626 [Dictyostelium purpureum]|uniref:Histone H2A/H2B/H3 domain-containing protein n=1 Tax=Dictyostelium purpureum TaxID=5786 RepID=F0ZPD0_DICPU|nr:uncharacterized protein DICPUDRAFT_153626 [Dictyostelium purpureum]EGC34222.1 hypothetical protein DICPUDRAFT_153626 [Dictyostelium purpureum]|eukprot:XP_003289274.1 hypothetical protein DICPUDRAFT_153626 [Dictyostelium purpureum]